MRLFTTTLAAVALSFAGITLLACDAGYDSVETTTSELVTVSGVTADDTVVFTLNPHPFVSERPTMVRTLPRWVAPAPDLDAIGPGGAITVSGAIDAVTIETTVSLKAPNEGSTATLPAAIQTVSYTKRLLVSFLPNHKGKPTPCPPAFVSIFGPDVIPLPSFLIGGAEPLVVEAVLHGVCETVDCRSEVTLEVVVPDGSRGVSLDVALELLD